MKQPKNDIVKTEEGFALNFRPRKSTTLQLSVPIDTAASLEEVAEHRDMSVEALIKLYIGQGLRQDLSQLFADRMLERTAQVLTRHLHSPEEVSNILKEIQFEAVA